MTDLFRFMVLRAPDSINKGNTIQIDGSNPSQLILDLKSARASTSPQASMIEVAQRYVSQQQFVATPSSLAYEEQYVKLLAAVQHAAGSMPDAKTLVSVTHAIFPNLTQVVAGERFLDDKRRVHDSLVALQVSPSDDNGTSAILVDLSRAIDILERVAADDASIRQPEAALNATTRIVVLPPGVFPIPSPLVGQTPHQVGGAPSFHSAEASEQVTALGNAIAAVDAMIAANMPTPSASHEMPTVLNPRLVQLANTGPRSVPKVTATALQAHSLKSPGTQITERTLTVAGTQALTPQVQQTLFDLKIDLTKSSLVSVSEQLKQWLQIIGGPPDPFHEPAPPLESLDQPPTVLAAPPSSHGSVMPAGIADLLVVREHVLRYESGEIAFVENVAAGEVFKRQTVRKNTSQDSTLTSTFFSSQTERDLQTSDRFNLQQQAQSTATQGTSAGANSSSYGPLVDSADSSSLSTAATSSAAAASSYAQDITSRAVSNLVASRQLDVFQQTTTEFDETVEHGVDNTKAGASPEIAVYQWLDKIVQAKVFSYGKRALYDFVIPEPAVFLAYSRKSSQPALTRLQEPTLFDLQPDKLSTDPKSDYFYQRWAAGYGATNVQPPPEPTVTVARVYGDKGSNPQGDNGDVLFNGVGAKDVIDVPAGYQAVKAYVSFDFLGGAPNLSVDVVVGDAYFFFSQTSANLNDSKDLARQQVGQVPVNISVWNAGIFTVNVEIVCHATDQSIAQWKARTHDTILQASRDRQAEYEDQLRKLTADVQIRYAGQSSDEKQTLIRSELEKSCVTILSNQHFDVLNTIEYAPGSTVTPQLFLPNFDPVSRYVRFFEQAFEWDQMLYRYLPYFWGRKKYWTDRLQLDDQDSEFAAFLRAGAARVTVPVRKGYESVVAAFMNNGTIPSTADMLAVTTGLYVPFFAELMGRDDGPDTAVSYGDPPLEWEIRVPTTLVKLRTDNTLPRWKQMVDAKNHVTYTPDVTGDPLTP